MKKRYLPTLLLLLFFLGEAQSQNQSVENAGDILLFALPAAALGSTLVIGDKKGTWEFSKGFLLNQAMTISLKEIVNKPRPFDNGNRAFPSGHTSTTFHGASFIQQRYGWKFGIPAYVLAGLTGYSRIAADRHDGWDVLAGAIVGIGSTYLFTTPYQRKHMEITFSNRKNHYSVGFRYKF